MSRAHLHRGRQAHCNRRSIAGTDYGIGPFEQDREVRGSAPGMVQGLKKASTRWRHALPCRRGRNVSASDVECTDAS